MKILTVIFCLFLSVNALAQSTGRGKPLYVIDGILVTDGAEARLNPAIVEKVSVLKGKAATDLYGKKAAYGVIIITTKKHKIPPRLSSFASLEHALALTPDSLKPLIAIDGELYKGNINAIDTSNVAGIDFVQQDWATVIYGKAGAHGVLDIKTKPQKVLDTLKKQ
jgi:TonB-dependent SusC/RagA subfamily outer membrane receptor